MFDKSIVMANGIIISNKFLILRNVNKAKFSTSNMVSYFFLDCTFFYVSHLVNDLSVGNENKTGSLSLLVPRLDCFWTHPYTVCVTSDGGEGAE